MYLDYPGCLSAEDEVLNVDVLQDLLASIGGGLHNKPNKLHVAPHAAAELTTCVACAGRL